MPYIYDDEDNAPMFDVEEHVIQYGGYKVITDKDFDEIPFDDPKPDNGCWNCINYDGSRCTAHWNNADPDYYNPDTDDKDPDDWCPDWEKEDQM